MTSVYLLLDLYLCLLSQSNPQDFSIPKPYDKLSTRGRESSYLRPRVELPAAAIRATCGRDSCYPRPRAALPSAASSAAFGRE